MGGKEKIKALAYLRTSSVANVGADKDSDKRQRATIGVTPSGQGSSQSMSSTMPQLAGGPY